MSFSLNDVQLAHQRIREYIRQTDLAESIYLSRGERRIFYKLETQQQTKSFKIRGALNKILTLTEAEREDGIAAISSGNHGSSVTYAAYLLGIAKVKIIVPTGTPQSKIDLIRFYGAEVLYLGDSYDEAHRLGLAYIEQHGLTLIDAYYSDPLVYAGQGSIAIEILQQNPAIDTMVVPIGGGGLITGIAVAAKGLKPSIRIIGVQTEACPAMLQAYRDNTFYEAYPSQPSLCDALVGGIGKLSF
ncbi:MAG: pyridoxal-phosphate dependent enzyme, partial [Symbiobacteriaceae bacterium]|nr:pyridoxal-phosphate dependent enzyme [Symbiobacteriaceae bacterium]